MKAVFGENAPSFTEQRHGSQARNEKVWEVAFAEWEGFATAAFFDHYFVDEVKWTDLEEAPAFEKTGREGVEELFHEITASFVPDFSWVVIFTLISAEWPLKKPEDISRTSWLFSKPRTKARWVLERRYKELGIRNEFVGRYFQWLGFRKNQNLLREYFGRLGRMPDDVPDMMFIPEDGGEPDFEEYAKYRVLLARFHDMRVGEIDVEETLKMFRKLRGAIYALDGHIYYTTTRDNMKGLESRAAELARQYGLEPARDLVPAGMRGTGA